MVRAICLPNIMETRHWSQHYGLYGSKNPTLFIKKKYDMFHYRYIERERDPSSLLRCDFCPVTTTIVVERDPATGELLGFKEVNIMLLYPKGITAE